VAALAVWFVSLLVGAAPGIAGAQTVQHGYALMDAGSALYGQPQPCDDAIPAAVTAEDKSRRGAVGVSFYRDPRFIGRVRVAFADGGVNDTFSPAVGLRLNQPVVGIATAPTGLGYWLAAGDGGVFSGPGVQFHGSMGGRHLNEKVVGIAATPSGEGYWLAAADGGVFSFGDAEFLGSLGAKRLSSPIVGMAASPTGRGYWLAAADGDVFTFGDAPFHGSRSGLPLNEPVVGIAATSSGDGYWLAAADGGVFAFGRATMNVSLAASPRTVPVVAIGSWPRHCP